MEINRFNGGAISAKVTHQSTRNEARDDASDPEGRDFASVFEKVAQPESQTDRQNNERDQPSERAPQTAERSEHQQEQSHDDSQDQQGQAAGVASWLGNTSLSSALPDVQAILPKPDLEAMLASIRTQMLPGGAREVTMALPHSVLNGLRVQLQTTPTGRITANFLTNDGDVKALLDTRTHELSELLRARGVNLVAVKTSLEAGTQQQHQSQQQQAGFRRAPKSAAVAEATDLAHTGERSADSITAENTADLWRA